MSYVPLPDYVYRTVCSCCGEHVTKEDRQLPGNNDTEGNLCGQCYGEHELMGWFHRQQMYEQVEQALNPINALRFRYAEPELKWFYVESLLRDGYIKYNIHGTNR